MASSRAEFVEDDEVGMGKPASDLSRLSLKFFLFESVDEFDGGEEPDALAMMFDGLDAERRSEVDLGNTGRTDEEPTAPCHAASPAGTVPIRKGSQRETRPALSAAIARQLGADQSLVGIVTRITRTDYAVTFKIRDTRTGAPIAVEQTDLRIGANYSRNRSAAWLIKNRLLEKQAQQ